ncbi:O-acyltransferase WSD [mine drainage metagenome]|uniref:O-acyltransferase WSD n=1 Tax=mine drainage metagenome TaxID=410659 RepID=A0A1J5PN91_9ZZZZ
MTPADGGEPPAGGRLRPPGFGLLMAEMRGIFEFNASLMFGPRQTLYAAGAELLHIFPVSISTHGLALNITVQSYRDQLDFGFIAGANIVPHVQVLCDTLPAEFEALEAAFAPPADLKSRAG